jgi:hypothetical protein
MALERTLESRCSEVVLGNPEHALDHVVIPHAKLDVCFAAKPGIVVQGLSFCENTANSVKSRLILVFTRGMQVLDYGAIEPPQEEIVPTLVHGQCDM